MQPSSLIFVVIVAIWVAYLIQHWVRRREHLATARSVDKFSEAMRVLERRTPLPVTVLAQADSGGADRSTARPEVVVKHAGVTSPLRARARAGQALPPAHPVPLVQLVPHRTPAELALRKVRGILFLAALVAVPVTVVLSAVHVLKWLSVVIALAALAASVVWLRFAALKDQAARRALRAQKRLLEESRTRVGATAVRRTTGAPAALADRTAPAPEVAATSPSQAASPAPSAPAGPVPAEAVAPGGWKPVPVPPPTYTLKDPAFRSEPAAEERPVPIEVDDDDLVVEVGPRRASR